MDAVVFKILNLTWEVQALPMASAIVACSLYFTRVRILRRLWWSDLRLTAQSAFRLRAIFLCDDRCGIRAMRKRRIHPPLSGKLYVHGLLRTLNMRAQLRRRVIQEEMCMHDLQPWLLRTKAWMSAVGDLLTLRLSHRPARIRRRPRRAGMTAGSLPNNFPTPSRMLPQNRALKIRITT